ncbi:MAG: hypothetical protein AAF633_17255, partial [Chloroflexota bacterium]
MPILRRLVFTILVTFITVFFSEKAYWYPTGYPIFELILFYSPIVYASLWAIDAFKVRSLSGLILVSALYAFLVEGVFTPVLYEGGIFNPTMAAYFIGWHGLLGIIFGFYFIRRWLVNREWVRLMLGSIGFGIFWGGWSLAYWLPQYALDYEQSTYWSPLEFGLHALVFTIMLIVAHLLLTFGSWEGNFEPTTIEKVMIVLILIFFYVAQSFPGAPFGLIMLIPLCLLVFAALWGQSRRFSGTVESALSQLNRP